MRIFKNKFIVILGTFLIVLLVIGGTYAYYSWNTSDAQKTNVAFTVTQPNILASINGTGSYTASNLVPTTCNGTNSIRETVTINYTNGTSYPVVLTANLRLTSFKLHNASYQPTKSELGALRWMISETSDSCASNSSDVIIGNKFDVLTFNSGQVDPSNSLPLTIGTIQFSIPANTNDEKTYYLYIWLDNSYTHENVGSVNSDPLQELTFSAQWDGTVEQDFGSNTNTEGYPVTISNSHGFGLTDYKIYGNSIQSGTPSPSSPQEVRSLGNGGRNLFDINNVNSASATYTVNNNEITINGTSAYNDVVYKKSVMPSTVYTLSTQIISNVPSSGHIAVDELDDNNIVLKRNTIIFDSSDTFKSFTTGSTTSKLKISLRNRSANVFTTFKNIQLELGLTATDYRPYNYIDINVSGKNLVNNYDIVETTSTPGSLAGATINSQYIDMIRQSQYDYASIPVSLKTNKTYTLWYKVEVYDRANGATGRTVVGLGFNEVGSNQLSVSENGTYYRVFTYTPTEDIDSRIILYANYGSVVPAKVKFQIMLVEGNYTVDTIPKFEPYYEPVTTTIDLSNHEPLMSLGTGENMSDYIDYENQQIIRNVGKIVLDGSNDEAWFKNSDSGDYKSFFIGNTYFNKKDSSAILCNRFQVEDWTPPNGNYAWYATSSTGIRINKSFLANYDSLSDDTQRINSFRTWLSFNSVIFYYQLATAVSEPISLSKINTFPGTNIITVDGEIIPSKITVKYNNG